jgi:selenocysteine-specific elongation factor
VALTKADAVSPERLELAQLEAAELLATTPFAGAPVLAVSARTGRGIPELRARLLDLAAGAARPRSAGQPTRLPIDRAFHLKGLGPVVSGTLVSGSVRAGDSLELLPGGGAARVRSVQVHGETRPEARAGERSALQLAGVELDELRRGLTLAHPGAFAVSRRLCLRLTLLAEAPAPLDAAQLVMLHLFTSESAGRLRPLGGPIQSIQSIQPGATGLAEVELEAPVVAARGDRFIVRRPSPPATLGGGEVLDPLWRRRRGGALAEALAAVDGGEPAALLHWVREAGDPGVTAAELGRRTGRTASEIATLLDALAAEQRLLAVPASGARERRWLAPAAFRRIAERSRRLLEEHARRNRLAPGLPRAEFARRALAGSAELTETMLDWLRGQGVIELTPDTVTLPGRAVRLAGAESELASRVVAAFEAAGLRAPSPSELRAELGAKPQIFDGVVRYLVERGRLVRLPGGLLLAAAAAGQLRDDLLGSGWTRFTVPEFKDRFGLTRKWAIPLLEHLDSIGVTRRMGDFRQIVRPAS